MENTNTSTSTVQKLAIPALSALVVGSMVGGGIFGLPSQMARAAAPAPMIIGWIISGLGMLMLALSFQSLATRHPHIDGGVYGYAKHGFGNYIGYCSAIGYWIGGWIGNVAFLVLFMSSLGTFFPVFKDGNTTPAIIGASIILWIVHFLVLRGVTEAAGVNVIVTLAKLIPLIAFIVVGLFMFDPSLLTADPWGANTLVVPDGGTTSTSLGSSWQQTIALMLITVWVFSGVEGAAVFSERAKNRKSVGKATVIGYLFVLALLVFVNVLSYGTVPQADLAKISDPSLAGVFAAMVGPWGAKFIAIGLMISLLGVFLSWVLLSTEILRIPAMEGVIPTQIGKLNKHGTPTIALWMTNLGAQALLLSTLYSSKTYEFLIILASGAILMPYMWVAFFQLKTSLYRTNSSRKTKQAFAVKDFIVGLLASIYAVWLIYAGGLEYFLGSLTAYTALTFLFVVARKQTGDKRVFKPYEWLVLAALIIGSIWFIWGFISGEFGF